MTYQELRAVLPARGRRIFRHNQSAPGNYAPGTVENKEPHCRSQRLGQELVSETGEMRVEAGT